jgi:hypothetical protein
MTKINVEKCAGLLKEKDNILILTHAHPDGDTLGCGFGLCRALLQMGKKARVICADEIPAKYDYLYKDMDVMKLCKQGNRYISDADISNYQKSISNISFSYRAETDTKIILPLVNYPGYVAVDQYSKKIAFEENDNHMIVIPLAKGSGSIKVWYKGLPLFRVADYISLISAIIFLCSLIEIYRRNDCNRLAFNRI